ncbi:MAG: ATP-binding protein [Firmicutes bacterium]|nr:ATP-binding protein [Bacillota bacterium]
MKILSKEAIDVLFENVNNNHFNIQEGQYVEFKLNFHISNKFEIFRIFAGMSNHRGGYVVFGVEPTNKKLIGLEDKAVAMYSHIDDEGFRGGIKSCFEPYINYEYNLYEFECKKFIIFQVIESVNKPIVCRANGGSEIKEGDIFYKYSDSVKKVAYSELSGILEEKRLREQQKWMDFFAKISKVGLDNLVLLDGKSGNIIAPSNNSIVLDSTFVEKLNYIKEGEFNEKTGTPTIKLIATLDSDNGTSASNLSQRKEAILVKDIFCDMLLGKVDIEPLEYIKQSCDLSGKFPIFYYIELSGKTKKEIISIINLVETTKKGYKDKIIKRINGYDRVKSIAIDPEGRLDPITDAMKQNRKLKKAFFDKGVDAYVLQTKKDLDDFNKVIKMLTKVELLPLKSNIFNKLYNYIQANCYGDDIVSAIPNKIKEVIWYMDEKIYT